MSLKGVSWIFAIITVLIHISFVQLPAQSQTYPFTSIEIQDGLQNLYIDDIHQDTLGYMWFSGSSGPVRYDGHSYKQFSPALTDSSFKSSFVRSIQSDQHGTPWFGYDGEAKISAFDYQRDSLITILVKPGDHFPQEFTMTRLMGVDQENKLWFYLIDLNQFHRPIVSFYDIDKQNFYFYADSSGQSTIPVEHISPSVFGSHFYYPFAIDHNNDVWIGSSRNETGGFVRLSGDTVHTVYTPENSLLKRNEITDIEQSVDSTLWISTYDGIYYKEKDSTSFQLLEETGGMGFYGTYPDRDGNVWMTSRYKTLRFNGNTLEEISPSSVVKPLERAHMYPIAESDSTIWLINSNTIGRTPQTRGVTVYNKNTQTYTPLFASRSNPGSLSGNLYIKQVYISRDGSVWISHANHALDHYHPEKKTFTTPFLQPDYQSRIDEFQVNTLAVSPQNVAWVGFANGNVFLLDLKTGKERFFKRIQKAKEGIRAERNMVAGFAWEKPGVVYIGSEWGALQKFEYNPETYEITDSTQWMPSNPTDPNRLPGGTVISLQFDDQSRLWVSSTSGVGFYRPETDDFENLYLADTSDYNPNHSFGPHVVKQGKYLWYYGENYSGIRRINTETKEIGYFNRNPETSDIIESVQDFLITRDNRVFLSRERDGLYLFDESLNEFKRFAPDKIGFVNGLSEGKNGNILAGTDNGLLIIHPDGEVIDELNKKDGLYFNHIFKPYLDSAGRYWMLSNMGAQLYSPESKTVTLFNEFNGLNGAKGDYPQTIRKLDEHVTMFSWRNPYPAYFNSDAFQIYKNPHQLRLTHASTHKRTLPLQKDQPISINNDERNLTFHVLLPDYAQHNRNTYRYKIEGFDDSWSDWTTQNVLNINDLPPGEYVLEVEARNFMNVNAQNAVSKALIIHPPWYASMVAILFYITGGGVLMFVGARRYSTYRTEQELMHLKAEQAEELAKLDRMKTNFLTNISHELRTPLSLLIGPIQQLMEQGDDVPDGWKQRLRVAQRNGLRLRELVEQVLDLTRLDAKEMNLKVKPTDLDYLLHLLCESFESMAKQNSSDLSYNRTEGLEPVFIDRDKLEKVLTNLISNAIRHTKNASITLQLINHDSQIEIVVSDTGEGISQEKLPHIFERFLTTADQNRLGVGGIGVGLAITKEFVEIHNGTIDVDSTVGKGTTFTIMLKKGTDHFPESTVIDSEANPRAGSEYFEEIDIEPTILPLRQPDDNSKPVLLVVEDNRDMQFYIRDVLGDQVAVHTAENGEEGRKMMALHKPDLIITDIMMPKMDGFEFAEWVKSQSEHMLTPIIVLSARAELEDRIKGFSIGVQDYLIKPFNPQELRVRVGNLLNFKRARDRFEEREEPEELNGDQQLLEDLRVFVSNRLDEEISVEQLAEAVHLSRRQLYRKLKSLTGFTPAQFTREIRLQQALTFLQQQKAGTISEIAHSVGFSTPGYFSRLFKERFGSSPGEYL